jgi:hypothetical protein
MTGPDSRRLPLVPPVPPAIPRWGNRPSRALGRLMLRGFGWRLAGELPNVPRLVAIAASDASDHQPVLLELAADY